MGFEAPLWLLLAVPWWVGWWFFARAQRRSHGWVVEHVSPRFRPRLSRHSRRSLRWHLRLVLVLGLALVVAAAGPYSDGRGKVRARGGPLVLVLDASASMYATDVERAGSEEMGQRFDRAQEIAGELVSAFEGRPVALLSYSGVATLHLPPVRDRQLIDEALAVAEPHTYYQNSGSSLAEALDAISRILAPGVLADGEVLQVVLLGDGEIPHDATYDEALDALADQGVVIHAVALGSLEGQARHIFDFRDVVAQKEDKRVVAEYTTRRVDEHFRRIADATDGRFLVDSGAATVELTVAIEKGDRGKVVSLEDRQARRDWTSAPLLLFLIGWWLDRLVIGRGRPPEEPSFRIDRLGTVPDDLSPWPGSEVSRRPTRARVSTACFSAASLLSATLLLLLGCGKSPLEKAHAANERGIDRDSLGLHDAARPHYLRSLGFQTRSEIPTHNLGRSRLLEGDFSEAHDLFQRALQIEPRLAEAHYHDGVTLYRWGQSVRDPEDCELERTRDLWRQALLRFEEVPEFTDRQGPLAHDAELNLEFATEALREVEALIAEPPEACLSDSPNDPPPQDPEDPQQGGGQPEDSDDPQGGGQPEDGDDPQGGGQPEDGDDPQGGGQPEDGDDPQGGGQPEDGDDPQGGGQPEDGDDPQGGGQPEDGDDPQGGGQPEDGDDPQGAPQDPGGDDPGRNDPKPGRGGQPPPPEPGDGDPGSGGGGGILGDDELDQVRAELERIRGQRSGEGKYYRRTRPEQFAKETWENPDDVIWW